jgi:hypothetical protein
MVRRWVARRHRVHRSVRPRSYRDVGIEFLEQRRLLASDVCFPADAVDRTNDAAAEPLSVMYGPSRLASTKSEADAREEGLAVPIVSVFPASGSEGDSFGPGESPAPINQISSRFNYPKRLPLRWK